MDIRSDTKTLLAEALLINHVVCLVKHEYFDLADIQLPPLDHIQCSPWSSHHDFSFNPLSSGDHLGDSKLNRQGFDEATHGLDDTHDLPS